MNTQRPSASASGQFNASTVLDSLGRPYTQLGNGGQQVDSRYDNNGNLKSRRDAANRVTAYDYDAQDRVTKITAPDGGETRMSYDAEGRLQYVIDPRGLQTSYIPGRDWRIHLNKRYLGKLSGSAAVELYDTIIHEGLHFTGPAILQDSEFNYDHGYVYPNAAKRTAAQENRFLSARAKACGCAN